MAQKDTLTETNLNWQKLANYPPLNIPGIIAAFISKGGRLPPESHGTDHDLDFT